MAVEGITTIANDVLLKIAVEATHEVDGVAQVGASSAARSIARMFGRGQSSSAGIDVNPGEAGSGETSFNLTLSIIFGYSIPDVVRNVRESISNQVNEMTGLMVRNIDIYVEDIVDQSQQNRSSIPLVDRLRGQSNGEEEEAEKSTRPEVTQLPTG